MRRVVIDFETRSEVDLFKHGLQLYATDKSTDVLMMAWKFDGDIKTEVWFPGDPVPYFTVMPDIQVYAFNAEFEMMIWNNVCRKKYGWPELKLKEVTCISALANRYSLPNKMGDVADALKCKQRKNPEGETLIQIFCTPKHGWPEHSDGRWSRFIQYCIDDVLAEEEILNKLPAKNLNDTERATWEQTVEMNMKGIPIDVRSVKQIRRVCEAYREAHYELLPELTGGKITKITQAKRIRDYCKDRGFEMENCTAQTVSEMLACELPDDVMQLLEMRSQIGMSSIGKYIRFENMQQNERIYFNQRYYGAHTGRWTSSGVQLYNLPRAKVKDPEAEIEKYFNGEIVNDNPIKSARALIRSMIKAEDGKILVWADWSSIEYVIIEWLAGDYNKLERFSNGFDQYVDQATFMYHKNYEDIESDERQFGKMVILGCGFGQGHQRLIVTAKNQWGLEIDEQESDFLVRGYRRAHDSVVSMWYALQHACVKALEHPGELQSSHRCQFKTVRDHTGNRWLTIRLPSGRLLFYFDPFIEMGLRGPEVCHWGFSQTIKKWMVMRMIPGRIAENIVQATSRCILVEAMAKLRNKEILWTTYDEIILQVNENEAQAELDNLVNVMCTQPEWCKDLPLKAAGFIDKRYRKA